MGGLHPRIQGRGLRGFMGFRVPLGVLWGSWGCLGGGSFKGFRGLLRGLLRGFQGFEVFWGVLGGSFGGLLGVFKAF
jgi:hypothetical protein